MNLVVLVGRLTRDPEVKMLNGDKTVATFSIAVDSGYGDKKKTDFVPIVVWNKLAEVCGNNITKGRKILVEGRLQIRDYVDGDGVKKRVAEVVAQNVEFLDSKQTAQGAQAAPAAAKSGQTDMSDFGRDIKYDDHGEEIPF